MTLKTDNWDNLVSEDEQIDIQLMLFHKQVNKSSLAFITDKLKSVRTNEKNIVANRAF